MRKAILVGAALVCVVSGYIIAARAGDLPDPKLTPGVVRANRIQERALICPTR